MWRMLLWREAYFVNGFGWTWKWKRGGFWFEYFGVGRIGFLVGDNFAAFGRGGRGGTIGFIGSLTGSLWNDLNGMPSVDEWTFWGFDRFEDEGTREWVLDLIRVDPFMLADRDTFCMNGFCAYPLKLLLRASPWMQPPGISIGTDACRIRGGSAGLLTLLALNKSLPFSYLLWRILTVVEVAGERVVDCCLLDETRCRRLSTTLLRWMIAGVMTNLCCLPFAFEV